MSFYDPTWGFNNPYIESAINYDLISNLRTMGNQLEQNGSKTSIFNPQIQNNTIKTDSIFLDPQKNPSNTTILRNNLPPGLAKKGGLPPGLAKKGQIPPGWFKKDDKKIYEFFQKRQEKTIKEEEKTTKKQNKLIEKFLKDYINLEIKNKHRKKDDDFDYDDFDKIRSKKHQDDDDD